MTKCKSCGNFKERTSVYGYCEEYEDTVCVHQIDNEDNCPDWKLREEQGKNGTT